MADLQAMRQQMADRGKQHRVELTALRDQQDKQRQYPTWKEHAWALETSIRKQQELQQRQQQQQPQQQQQQQQRGAVRTP